MLIPEDTELPPDFVQNWWNFPAGRMEFPTAEQFKKNKVLHDKIVKWREVPIVVIYRIESVKEITPKSGLAVVVSLVDEDGMSFEAFATSCLEKDLIDFGWGKEWFIKSLGQHLSSRNPDQSYYHYQIMRC